MQLDELLRILRCKYLRMWGFVAGASLPFPSLGTPPAVLYLYIWHSLPTLRRAGCSKAMDVLTLLYKTEVEACDELSSKELI